MKRADTVLGPMLKRLGIESGVRLERIRNDWSVLFEPALAAHMFPSGCTGQELLLTIDSPLWMQHLMYYKKEILQKLSPFGITEVRFRLGKIRKPSSRQTLNRKSRQLSDEEVSFITETVSEISDEHLKKAISNAIEKSFSFRKRP